MLPLICSLAVLGNLPAVAPVTATEASPVEAVDPGPFGSPTPFVSVPETVLVPGPVDPDALPSQSSTADHYAPNIYRQFNLSLGVAAYDKFDTNLRVSGQAGLGATLDLEDFLGIDNSDTIGRLDAQYSFNRRHRIDASYYDIRRSGTASIGEDIEFGDVVIPAGDINTFFDTQIFKLAYRYNFVTDYRTVIGASIGAHVMGINAGISNDSFAVEEEFKVSAPLPLLGLHGAYALSDKWSLNASLEFLQFDVQAYRGFISDSRVTIEHDTFDNFGWGIGFNGFKIDGSIDGDDGLNADLEYGYQGLMLYLRWYF